MHGTPLKFTVSLVCVVVPSLHFNTPSNETNNRQYHSHCFLFITVCAFKWLRLPARATHNCQTSSYQRMSSQFSLCQLVILFLSVEFSTVSCDTFYMVTSPSSPCPGEYIGVPCLTLQQYASNPSRSQSITFLVEPGMYNLSTVLTVSDAFNFTMSSTNATVTCTSATAKFEFNRVENVYISGMTFQRCRSGAAVQMTTVTMVIIMRNNFSGNQGNCLQASYSSVNISNSNFHNNRQTYGRALHISFSNITITKSVLSNNRASVYDSGGAIYALDSNITVESSEFSSNYAYYRGGAIYIENRNGNFELRINGTILYGNRAHYRYDGGGAIYMYLYPGSYRYRVTFDLQLNNTLFYGNQAIRGDGGAIYMYNYNRYYILNFRVQMDNLMVYNNRADQGYGGAVYIRSY